MVVIRLIHRREREREPGLISRNPLADVDLIVDYGDSQSRRYHIHEPNGACCNMHEQIRCVENKRRLLQMHRDSKTLLWFFFSAIINWWKCCFLVSLIQLLCFLQQCSHFLIYGDLSEKMKWRVSLWGHIIWVLFIREHVAKRFTTENKHKHLSLDCLWYSPPVSFRFLPFGAKWIQPC